LRDSITVTNQATLKAYINRVSTLPLTVSLNKVVTEWAADSTYLIQDTDIQAIPLAPVGIDSSAVKRDSVVFNLPAETIQGWKLTGVTGLNFALKRNSGEGWVEFKAVELSKGTALSFNYKVPGDTVTYKYSQSPTRDSYQYIGTATSLYPDSWRLKNLLPQRLYARFELPQFVDTEGVALSAADLKRMTINKAELVLFTKNESANPYYQDKTCYFYPFNVKHETLITSPYVISTATDLERITNTISSYKKASVNDSVSINITAIVQGLTSGKIALNNGVVIVNNSELLNFGTLEFWHYSNAPAGKKPYVKVYYTAPFLNVD
jgi:hypothetical protein